jgi:hypothetical protein
MANVIPLGASTSKYGCLPFLLIQILVIQIVYCIGCSVATLHGKEPRSIDLLKEHSTNKCFEVEILRL